MTIYLKQSTASQEVILGRFVDSTDGNTEKTALTIANTDIKIWKNGATTLASKNSGGGTHISNGIYYAVLDATDTNTLGPLEIHTHVSGALPTKQVCCVLAANVFDSLIGGGDILDVSVTQWTGTNVATPDTAGYPKVTHKSGTGAGELNITSGVVDANATKMSGTALTARDIGASVLLSAGTGTGQLDFTSGVVKANLAQILGTALTETAGQIAAAFKQFFNIASPTSTMNAITAVTTVTTVTNLTNAPTAGDLTATMKASVTTAATAATPTAAAVTGNVGGNVVGSIGSLGATAKSDVNAEVVDAINTDTYAEPGQGAPGATISLAAKIGYLYKAWRNKSTQTASTYSLFADDASTVDQKASVADDGTTFTRNEIASGP